MRTRAVISSTLASIGLLAIGWQIGAPLAVTMSTTTSAPVTPGTTGATSGSPASSGPADGTYVGDSVRTQFGDVQVQVTFSAGSITDVSPMHLTDRDGRSVQISNRAAPLLRTEVLASQSAQVSVISGATYTSLGYLNSLQSALDAAGA